MSYSEMRAYIAEEHILQKIMLQWQRFCHLLQQKNQNILYVNTLRSVFHPQLHILDSTIHPKVIMKFSSGHMPLPQAKTKWIMNQSINENMFYPLFPDGAN